jgi:hexosaminidase
MQTSERTDYQAFPRAMAIAETAWTQNANKDWKNFCERMVTEFERLEVMNTKPCLNFFDVNVNTHADENAPLMVLLESFYPNAEIRYTTDVAVNQKSIHSVRKAFQFWKVIST